jgi:hypothetical protein
MWYVAHCVCQHDVGHILVLVPVALCRVTRKFQPRSRVLPVVLSICAALPSTHDCIMLALHFHRILSVSIHCQETISRACHLQLFFRRPSAGKRLSASAVTYVEYYGTCDTTTSTYIGSPYSLPSSTVKTTSIPFSAKEYAIHPELFLTAVSHTLFHWVRLVFITSLLVTFDKKTKKKDRPVTHWQQSCAIPITCSNLKIVVKLVPLTYIFHAPTWCGTKKRFLSQLSDHPSYSTVRVRLQFFVWAVSQTISCWALYLVLTAHLWVTIDEKTKERKRSP